MLYYKKYIIGRTKANWRAMVYHSLDYIQETWKQQDFTIADYYKILSARSKTKHSYWNHLYWNSVYKE